MRLRSGAAVRSAGAKIVVLEHVEVSAGSSTQTHTHTVAERVLAFAPAPEPGVFRATLPAAGLVGLPPTFGLPRARIAWRLDSWIERPRGPSWHGTVDLYAYPGGDRPVVPSAHSIVLD
jgi:hypothetical protein